MLRGFVGFGSLEYLLPTAGFVYTPSYLNNSSFSMNLHMRKQLANDSILDAKGIPEFQ